MAWTFARVLTPLFWGPTWEVHRRNGLVQILRYTVAEGDDELRWDVLPAFLVLVGIEVQMPPCGCHDGLACSDSFALLRLKPPWLEVDCACNHSLLFQPHAAIAALHGNS